MSEKCKKTGKRILTRKEAQQQALWWRINKKARMGHFKCKSCNGFHIGNSRGKPRRRK